MASPTDPSNDPQGSGTPVPPRGQKRKPPRPGSGPRNAGKGGSNRRAAVARQRQQRQTRIALIAIGLVIVVVAVFVIIKVAGGGSSTSASGSTTRTPVTAAQYNQYTSVSSTALAAAANNFTASELTFPTPASDASITSGGKPEVLFVGAEYCPYCAAERWALVLALSKFGTFHNLSSIYSSSSDVYPSTPTWTFYGSTYTSPYLTFTPVELYTVNDKPLQTATSAELAIYNKYDGGAGYPFAYLDGKAIVKGAEYNPQLLHGLTFDQALNSINGGTSALANNVYADAGAIVSELCQATGAKPANVCSSFPKPITTS